MRNINIIIIMMSLCFGGCDCGGKRIDRKYVIENNTVHKIKMDVYLGGSFRYSKEKSGRGVIQEVMGTNDKGKTLAAFIALRGDSVVIVFDDTKRIIYYQTYSLPMFRELPDNKRNILDDSTYAHESNTLYRYTFTEEDYNNAADL